MTERMFNEKIGELIRECQCIECDIKLMYAGMLAGEVEENYKQVENLTMGEALNELQELDNSDGTPYLSSEDYKLLRKIKSVRNHWVHKGYVDFIYAKNKREYISAMTPVYEKLCEDYYWINELSDKIEHVRLDMMRNYGRMD